MIIEDSDEENKDKEEIPIKREEGEPLNSIQAVRFGQRYVAGSNKKIDPQLFTGLLKPKVEEIRPT